MMGTGGKEHFQLEEKSFWRPGGKEGVAASEISREDQWAWRPEDKEGGESW